MATGKVVFKVGNDISTDIIYPGRFMATVLPTETPKFAFMDATDFNKALNAGEVPAGSVVVGGANFGCGSSREQAASCLKGHGLTIVAKNFARIFLQNAINVGLSMVICPEIEAEVGDELVIEGGKVTNKASGKSYAIEPMPKARQAILDAGGLIPYVRRLMLEETAAR